VRACNDGRKAAGADVAYRRVEAASKPRASFPRTTAIKARAKPRETSRTSEVQSALTVGSLPHRMGNVRLIENHSFAALRGEDSKQGWCAKP